LQFTRYKPGDPLSKLSASDMNDRAEALERVDRVIRNEPGFVGFGVMWGKITARSSSSPAAGITYQAEALDGSIRITTNQTPLFRPFASSTLIVPAAIDSACLIGWYPDPATNQWLEKILTVQETEDSAECA
jgi:hypothetical protein